MAIDAALFPGPEPDRRDDPARAEALVESYRRLAAVFHDVLSEQSPDALLDRIADTLAELIPYEALHIYEADEKQRELVPVFARSDWAEEILSQTVSYGQGITGWAVAHRSPVLANNAHLDPRVSFVPGTPQDPEALITVPLIARGQLKGALNIYRVGEDASFDDDDFELARWFGDAAALSLDNAQIRARLEHLAHTDSLTGLHNHRYFHERLRSELHRAGRAHDSLALLMLDIDDFKRVNDVCGHAEGDEVLKLLAELLKGVVRTSDTVCRVGGEEFAVILPSCDAEDALGLATRLREALMRSPADSVGEITLSMGIALGPEHAMNARELIACAETAMMTAKAQGKDRVIVFDDSPAERPADESEGRDLRSIAHLKMLQSLARKLNRLNDVSEIGEAIVDELRMLVDYHNCAVYLLDGEELSPVTVRGANEDEIGRCKLQLGEGLTGHVALTGKPAVVANARESELCTDITGLDADESLASAPLRYGQRVVGAITISKLGVAQFDEDDLRLLEVLAGHASVSLENARLYGSLRREAENAKALLEFADAVTEARSVEEICDQTVRTVSRLLEAEQCSMWIEDTHAANYRCLASVGYAEDPDAAPILDRKFGRTTGAHLIDGRKTPFVVGVEGIKRIFSHEKGLKFRPSAVAPLHKGFGMRGWITVRAPGGDLSHFTDERLRLLEGLAYRASVALQNSVLLQSEQESAEVASKLLEFSRRLAGAATPDELQRRIVELTGEMVGSPRTWLWLERGRPGSFAIAAAWRDDGAVPIVPIGSVVEFGRARRALERGEPFVLEPGSTDMVPVGDDPLAVAPVVLPSGRIGCIAAAAPETFCERKLRLLAGIATQASLALHISQS
ncbi:MAG TPA: GAF domain-containing protein [Gaiellaceae bacterium]|nr:GAF domain-containing protein [Gaiellaceae bacterium]